MLKEIELHHKTLTKILDEIPAKIFLKDSEGRMVIVNKSVLKAHNSQLSDLIGKNDFDFISDYNEAKKCYDEEQNIINSGEKIEKMLQENINNTGVFLKSIKMPFYIDYLGETGLLGIQNDVTELVNLREKVSLLEMENYKQLAKKREPDEQTRPGNS
jgi:PAS domain S-box-containing protein